MTGQASAGLAGDTMRHVVIIPARNEEEFLARTLQSILRQSEPPDRIYVVDDGSTDATPDIVRRLAAAHPSVHLVQREDRGGRRLGGGVVDTFNAAYDLCRHEAFTYVSKIDADQILPVDYFERLLAFLDRRPDYAAASGVPWDRIGQRLVRERMPRSHVAGSLKTVRKRVFDEMGGFLPTLGWDILDVVKMRSLGYRTGYVEDLRVEHLRQHASAEGVLKGKAQWGEGAYIIGSHPLFVIARGVYRMLEPPYVIGGFAFWWGYVKAVIQKPARIPDTALITALRREQITRLVRFNRLTAERPVPPGN
jgi:poly-beta-1,6-N-acetyl-D-glucosamine synthase